MDSSDPFGPSEGLFTREFYGNCYNALKDDGIIGENQILIGFPHPSGANVNRVKQLEENKENMISFIKNKF